MKECKDCENDYPDVASGDTVKQINGNKYLVCNMPGCVLRLFNIETGYMWDEDALFSNPENKWEKVNICYKVER